MKILKVLAVMVFTLGAFVIGLFAVCLIPFRGIGWCRNIIAKADAILEIAIDENEKI